MPTASTTASQPEGGTTGAELSAEASEFLLEFARDADRAAQYAQTCSFWIQQVGRECYAAGRYCDVLRRAQLLNPAGGKHQEIIQVCALQSKVLEAEAAHAALVKAKDVACEDVLAVRRELLREKAHGKELEKVDRLCVV